MFSDWVQDLMDRPENVGLSGPKKRLYKNKKCQKKMKRIDKSDISSPCWFKHNVSLSVEDKNRIAAMQGQL